jgi:gliding motility-associated-like protein
VLSISNDTIICRGDTIQLKAEGSPVLTWSPSSGISCTGCASPLAYPLKDQYYKLKGTDDAGCSTEDSVLVKVVQPLRISVSPQTALICIGKKVQLTAAGAANYLWSPSLGLNAINSATPIASPVSNTTYTVIGYDSLKCFIDSAVTSIRVLGHPTVDLGPDLVVSAGSSKTFAPRVSPDVTNYWWTPSAGLSCSTCPNPVFTASTNTSIVLRVANAGGCSSSDTLKVIVSCNNSNVFVPNTFTPNGDGINDIFYLRGSGSFSVRYFRVFNRWGETVFEKKNISVENPSLGWNGIYNGKRADGGVYTYYIEVLCPGGEVLKYIGNVSLIQ